jgi:hypothetical protein
MQVAWKMKVHSALLSFIIIRVSQPYTAILILVACHVGDWVEVECDYSPGTCSEGGTGVVVATMGGKPSPSP